jgi:short-subunit dehydrogenase
MENESYKPVVLITGCSSGIGSALAKLFLTTTEYRVVVTAREHSMQHLHETFQESERFMIRSLDVTNNDQIEELVADIYRTWRGIDVLINNAGISYRSVAEHMDEDSELLQLKTNYLGPMAITRSILPTMREKGRGKIVNISSVSGLVAMPTMGSYSASKAALEAASEALWYEMKPFGVNVSIIQPGFVHSDSYRNVYFSKKANLSKVLNGPYSIYYRSLTPFIEKLMSYSRVTPDKIAARILSVIESDSPPLWVPVTTDAKIFSLMKRLMPNRLFYFLMFKFLPSISEWGAKYPNEPKLRAKPVANL